MVVLEAGEQRDGGVRPVHVHRRDLLEGGEVVPGGDDEETGHVGRVCRVHHQLQRLDDHIRLDLKSNPVLTLKWSWVNIEECLLTRTRLSPIMSSSVQYFLGGS